MRPKLFGLLLFWRGLGNPPDRLRTGYSPLLFWHSEGEENGSGNSQAHPETPGDRHAIPRSCLPEFPAPACPGIATKAPGLDPVDRMGGDRTARKDLEMKCVRCGKAARDRVAEHYEWFREHCPACAAEVWEIGRLVALEVEARGHISIDREPRGPTVVRTPGDRESSAESLLEALRKNKEIT